jgi:hypothetical protein
MKPTWMLLLYAKFSVVGHTLRTNKTNEKKIFISF